MRRFFFAFCLIFIFAFKNVAQEPSIVPVLIAQYGRGEVKSVTWSPDGQSVWVGTTEGTWQLDSALNEIRAFPDIRYGALSPDGKWLAGYSHEPAMDRIDVIYPYLVVINLSGNTAVQKHYHTSGQSPVVWSPTSKHFATPEQTAIYTIHSQEIVWLTSDSDSFSQPLVWSPSGAYLAGYRTDRSNVWVVDDEGERVPLENEEQANDGVDHLVWGGDTLLHWNSSGNSGKSVTWTIPTGEMNEKSNPCSAAYHDCVGNGLGTHIAAAGSYQFRLTTPVGIFGYPPGEEYLFGDNRFYEGFTSAWTSDSAVVAVSLSYHAFPPYHAVQQVATDTHAILWDTRLEYVPQQMVWSPDDSVLLTISDGRLLTLEGKTGARLHQNDAFAHVPAVTVTSDGQTVIVADSAHLTAYTVSAGRTGNIPAQGFAVTDFIWQPQGNKLAVVDTQWRRAPMRVRVWDVSTGQVETLVEPQTEAYAYPLPVVWSPDGAILAVKKDYHDIQFFYDRTDSVTAQPEWSMGGVELTELMWVEGDALPIAMVYSCCIRGNGFDLNTGERITLGDVYVRLSDGRYLSLNWKSYPHGRRYSAPELRVFSAGGEEEIIALKDAERLVTQAWLSPSGGYAAGIDGDGDGLIWRTDGTIIHFLSNTAEVVWSPDDSRTAIQRRDGSVWLIQPDNMIVRLWSPAVQFTDLPSWSAYPIPSLVWSGDGSTLAYRYGGVVRVWRL